MSRIIYQSKENGRAMLRGNWSKAIIILALTALMLFGLSSLEQGYRTAFGIPFYTKDNLPNTSGASLLITAASTFLCLMLMPPLIIGQTEWYWSLSEGREPGIGDAFGWFGSLRQYWKSVVFCINLYIRYFLWALLILCLPMALVMLGAAMVKISRMPSDLALGILLMIFGTFLLLGALFLFLYVMMRYYLAVYLLVEDSGRKVRACIKESVRLTRGVRWDICQFVLSFLLWFLSCYFIFPALYVVPYFNASSTVFARHLLYAQRAKGQHPDNDTTEFKSV